MTSTPTADAGPQTCDLLVHNAYLITVNAGREIYVDGALAVDGRRLVAVGRTADVRGQWRGTREINAQGAVVHPGFIETHMHIALHGGRNAINEPVKWDEQQKFYADFWSAIDDEDEFAGSQLAILELVKYGATAFMDCGTTHEPDAVARASEAVGIRARLGDPFLWDVGGFGGADEDSPTVDRAPASLERSLSLLGGQLKRNGDRTDLVQGHIALIGMATCSDELTLAAKEAARQGGVTFNQHQSYCQVDVDDDVKRLGRHPLVHFAELGVLDPGTTFAHVNIVRDDELAAVTDTGFTVSWNPISSQMYGVGATAHGRHYEMGRRGVNLALGSDSPNYTGRYDTGAQAFQAVLSSRDQALDAVALNAENGLEMATINGARALSAEDLLGSLEVGKLADFVIRRTDTVETTPVTNRIQNLIYSSRSTGIDVVVVNGVVVVQDGISTQVDEAEVRRRAQQSSTRILTRIGYQPKTIWPEIH
jgi:5-methylthioadenosine/S-adenosylhomocysteine deaminase